MKRSKIKASLALILALVLLLVPMLSGCGANDVSNALDTLQTLQEIYEEVSSEPAGEAKPEAAPAAQTAAPAAAAPAEQPQANTEAKPDAGQDKIDEHGSYTAPEDVALYLHTYGRLPENFITKSEAQALGWDSGKGNLWDVAPGKSIGGDNFGNREGLLPKGVKYHECDVDYAGGYRGSDRIIYGDDGSVYYTTDHYASFTQLY